MSVCLCACVCVRVRVRVRWRRQCVYGPTVTWGAKSDVGIAMLDGGAGAALPVKRTSG